MSNASASNGAGLGSGVGDKMVADTVEEICTTSSIAAVDNSPPGVIINTLCLKDGRFLKPDAGAIALVEQLPPTLAGTAGAGDDTSDAGNIVDKHQSRELQIHRRPHKPNSQVARQNAAARRTPSDHINPDQVKATTPMPTQIIQN